ncbi:MAG: HEAT repeat domain-containing protein [Planctomycetota bacterium]
MRNPRRVLVVSILPLLTLTCIGWALSPVVYDLRLVYQLENGPRTKRRSIVRQLVERRSSLAIDPLAKIVEEATVEETPEFRQKNTIHFAAQALVDLGNPAVPRICGLARHESPRTREQAAFALGRLKLPSEQIPRTLMDLLGDSSTYVRRVAIHSLGRLGERAQIAASRLIRSLEERNSDSYQICVALRRIPLEKPEVGRLCRVLLDIRSRVGTSTCNVADVLGSQGAADRSGAVSALVEAIGKGRYVSSSVQALVQLHPGETVPAEPILKTLERAGILDYSARHSKSGSYMERQSYDIKREVVRYLRSIGLERSGLIEPFENTLRHSRSEATCLAIIDVLVRLRTDAQPALPLLNRLHGKPRFRAVREAIEAALKKLGRPSAN